jgi:hypothetical protein
MINNIMYYLIYKITNVIDGKYYIGAHKTLDENDPYMGSGKYIKRAIKKYGIENFIREILFVLDNEKDMYAKEAELVDRKFLKEQNTYNIKVGGFGGWANDEINKKRASDADYDANWRKKRSDARKLIENEIKIKRELDPEFDDQYIEKAKTASKKGRETLKQHRIVDVKFDLVYKEKNSKAGKLGANKLLEKRQADPEFDALYRKSLSDAAIQRNKELRLRREADPEFDALYRKNMSDAVKRGKEAAKSKKRSS